MDTPRDIPLPPLTFAAARRVLVALRDAHPEPRCGASLPSIEGYAIERELGRGAGGVTYLAHKSGSGAMIALKVLHLPLGHGAAPQRAWRELDALQQVRSPSVPRLLDFGTTDRSLYIATEYVEGTPLHSRFQTPVPRDADDLRTRVRLLQRLARAAHSLHERAVIHRDLKPSNVIVGEGDEPVIIDLGIALLVTPDPAATLTLEGAPVGTPAFMAPEQARGERDSISTRSDVYSLGAIGYWLCTGQTPHDLAGATLHEAIRRVGSEQPRHPCVVWRQFPKPLAAVLAKACAPRPADRYASAADLAEDLRRCLAREPVMATRTGAWRRAVHWIERRPVATTAIACATMVVTSVTVAQLSVWKLYREPYKIEHDADNRAARLESRLGTSLAEWRAAGRGASVRAELFDAGGEIQPRRRVATTVHRPIDLPPELDGQLCIWDADEPSRLLWHTRGDPGYLAAPRENLPEETSHDFLNSPESYSGGYFLVAEVFDESPGNEIIMTHHHQYDPAAIRIYSAVGEVLFEAWHWGATSQPVWLPDERLIVVHGCNNELPLEAYGIAGTTFRWPRVIFAVRPEYHVRRGWANPNLARDGESAAWYKCLLPLEVADHVSGASPTLSRAPPHLAPARLQFDIDARPEIAPGASIVFSLDGAGNSTTAPLPSDGWKQREHPLRMLRPYLGDLPNPDLGGPIPRNGDER